MLWDDEVQMRAVSHSQRGSPVGCNVRVLKDVS